ncbi:hypothetical protein DLD77_04280 [Chitinophaga alhagiae]|uniref:DUF1440 domain-containing protein n=1 Tax=Chitinophaga alhagiae TaxID=2203219 RepID=A0ABN5LTE6_9BACT|nr:hypothetical protein [Chitinophaga alhagiae]AWO00973.1 hypothetical protein DLD77_04280 [Chitinophaga alhagiae]
MQFSTKRPGAVAVLVTGCAVGVLDGAAALVNAWLKSGIPPEKVFRYIASAMYGKAAYTGGGAMIAAGVVLHFIVAVIWSAVFFIAYRYWPLLRGNKWVVGCMYGLFVWLMMNLVVVPLTHVPPLTFNWEGMITGWVIHMLLVGIPIVWLTQWWYNKRAQ